MSSELDSTHEQVIKLIIQTKLCNFMLYLNLIIITSDNTLELKVL